MSALLWIMIIVLLVAITCALAGSFLQLKRQPLMGDAMSHAVLPGIAVPSYYREVEIPGSCYPSLRSLPLFWCG